MLMVIFGAGASYDAFRGFDLKKRVPLVKDLFDHDVRRSFASTASMFGPSRPLVQELREKVRSNEHVSLEDELDRLQERAKIDEDVASQMMALRFYLAKVIADTSSVVVDESDGFTSYVRLLRDIGRWQKDTDTEVALVTFNYDTMLEDAVADHTGRPLFADFDRYVRTTPWRVFKLHGSVSWSREIQLPGPSLDSNPQRPIELAHTIDPRDGDLAHAPFDAVRKMFQGVVIPAIAIPTITKTGLECPAEHQQVFSQICTQVDRVLVVGWRGAETHVRDAMLGLRRHDVKVGIVDRDADTAFESVSNIKRIVPSEPTLFHDKGFARFAASGTVLGWLAD